MMLPPFWNHAPVLAISGYSGSGKTTLIEQLIPALQAKGLSIAVLKHDVHGVQIDQPGKDSDRFYQAGADVVLDGKDDFVTRQHRSPALLSTIKQLVHRYDLVLLEGHKNTPLPKIWLKDENGTAPPAEIEHIELVLERDCDRLTATLGFIEPWLQQRWLHSPVLGCVLIGGSSSRMGSPKHLIQDETGATWLERIVSTLKPVVDDVVIVGKGDVPDSLAGVNRLVDVADIPGPMAGMLSAMRWQPDAAWLVCACDMPNITPEALQWLLAQRQPGVWGVMPDLYGAGKVEPLLAYYDMRAHGLFEQQLELQRFGPGKLAAHDKIITPQPPAELRTAWCNINDAQELKRFTAQ